MTWLLIALAVAAAAFACSALALAYVVVRSWRMDRRWERERERVAKYHEREAAQNGRPRSGSVTMGATRRQ